MEKYNLRATHPKPHRRRCTFSATRHARLSSPRPGYEEARSVPTRSARTARIGTTLHHFVQWSSNRSYKFVHRLARSDLRNRLREIVRVLQLRHTAE